MAEVKIGGKYLWKQWCTVHEQRQPYVDEDYGKVVTVIAASPIYPRVVRAQTADGHVRFGRDDDLEEIPHAKE